MVQNPTLTLEGDVAAVHLVLDQLTGPVVLVGHSYGGVIITEAGNHETVAALVYVGAFAPDTGESVNSLLAGTPPDAPVPPIVPVSDQFLALDREQFPAAFAADVSADLAAFMADSQTPWRRHPRPPLAGEITDAAWHHKPSWFLVTGDDRMIPSAAQHGMADRAGATVTETAASHSVFLSKPDDVADVIRQAIAGIAYSSAGAGTSSPAASWRRRLRMRRRSRSEQPPQTPWSMRFVRAYSRHGSWTGQSAQMRRATSTPDAVTGEEQRRWTVGAVPVRHPVGFGLVGFAHRGVPTSLSSLFYGVERGMVPESSPQIFR